MNYWLLKSDPQDFSWDDLKKCAGSSTVWDGVRNYQARNFLKLMKMNDLALFYHSGTPPQKITGTVRIIKEAYPDPSQFEPASPYYDSRSKPDNPTWFMVDIQIDREFRAAVTREKLSAVKDLHHMILFKNSRLSVQPVTAGEWKIIMEQEGIQGSLSHK